MSYKIKHHTAGDTKTILDPAGWELITIQDLHRELNELLARAESAEKLCDYWEARAKAVQNERDEAIRKASVCEKIALREAKINGDRLLNKEMEE